MVPPNANEGRTTAGRYHARRGVVIPIGVIVAVAIICVVVAVLGSAQRADEVAIATERQLFTRALHNHGERMLREVDAVANSEAAYRKIRLDFDIEWVQVYVGQRLQSYFDHHFVFVADSADRFLYATLGNRRVDPNWFNSVRNDLNPALDQLRGRTAAAGSTLAGIIPAPGDGQSQRVNRLQTFLGRPAILVAVGVATSEDLARDAAERAPVVMSVKMIDSDVLAEIASHLQLRNLRQVNAEPIAPGDYAFKLNDSQGQQIATFAWTPTRPGAEIVNSVIPFVAVALAGFALLAALVLGHMRRTAATIASGESRLRHLALHDPLCGLPNRIFFGERLEVVIADVLKGSPPAAVLYIDLDHFKDVNDTLGHPIGDELIRAVTQRLTHTVRDNDLVARIGGDEFAVITAGGSDHSTLLNIANRLIAAICAPYTITNQTIVIGASIGIAVVTDKIAGTADIMRHADMALYRAKNEGRNRACIYDTAMDSDLIQRKLVENDLRLAIERNELRVAYQPIVNNSGETVVGVEALCRWTHPVRGEISPAEFIPIAENSGLIIDLGEWMLRRACIDGNAWPGVTVAVNVSPLQFRRADFVDVVERIIAETGFDPTRLELEVTESTLLGNVDTAELAMFRLKALGVRLALDDFGTGYSSLLYLRRFPFDKLKIDRSFVHSIERAADAAAIVHAVVSLGRGLGMKVTAEGVETAEQHLFLRAAGIHSMQGYRFGRPGPAADITARLATPEAFRIKDETSDLAMAG
ncbi:MAG: EAL domain-containing protein [Xanthobacteraceae bacterium]|nr:EAL domain-containing protein [Xanthobacteraceae bacterium]